MKISKRFAKSLSYGILISIILIFFYIYLKFNDYPIARDEYFHLDLFNSSINYESIFSILRARIPYLLFVRFIDYVSFNIFDSLTVLRISSIFFGLIIFSFFLIYKLNFKKPLSSLWNIYLYFPFLGLLIISLSGQRDTMLFLCTIGLYNLENIYQKGFLLLIVSLLRPHMGISHLFSLIYTKITIRKKNIIFIFLPLIIGSLIAYLIVTYLLSYMNLGLSNFSLLNFIESVANVFGIGFIFVPEGKGLENSISTPRELLFLARVISPALFIIPFITIRKLIAERFNKNDKSLNKLILCFNAYLTYTSFCSMFGFQSARQQLPYILALSFLYSKNKRS